MRALRLAWLELRRLRGPRRRWVPLVLLLVPLLFGGLFLWANWDPYGRTGRVPVAVVNADQPVDRAGERINAGEQFVEQLKARRIFDWHFVGAREARRGLEAGDYYFTVEVPPDFSARLATAGDPHPVRAELRITKNDANGFLAGLLADHAEHEIHQQVDAAAHASYARALYGELDVAKDRLRLASDAARRLVEGSELGRRGTEALTEGLGGIRDSTERINRGAEDVTSATAKLDQQLGTVTEFTAAQLPGAVNAVVGASGSAVGGLSAISSSTAFLDQRAGEGASALDELGGNHPELAGDPAYQRALTAARAVADAAGTANADASRALESARAAQAQALGLRESLGPLQERVRSITAPLDDLRSGSAEIAGGSGGLVGGLNAILAGSGVLRDGTDQLTDGAEQLRRLVDDARGRLPETNPTQVARAADVLASPTELRTGNLHPAHVYGRGMAPLLFALALWVFGLIAYLLLKPLNTRALTGRVSALSIAMAGYLPAAVLGVAGGLALLGAMTFGLGLNPVQPWPAVGLVSLGAGAFVALSQLLRVLFGAVGALLALVLLVVQLTACGGLYPVETTPQLFQALQPLLPMTYLVDGLRVTTSGGLEAHLVRDLIVLAGFLVGSLVLTTLAVVRRRTYTLNRLHPVVVV
ncbi:YhgE/Pip family protein [Saccharopolyspora cebuensis]|uniref:YhgE/Pip family protein n=1 Tax=Saccharopolyspora cebuensis TaxID=418759 RepID=A0ABV4CKL6_9PSEU